MFKFLIVDDKFNTKLPAIYFIVSICTLQHLKNFNNLNSSNLNNIT